MFILTKIADLVQIKPEDFDKPAAQAIEDNINAKYSNKVIQKIGLCICLYDLLFASEGLIGHGDGLINVNVEFRMIVFRPFKHEVMVGRISSATPQGIRIRTHFFDNIEVPYHMLPEGAEFSHQDQMFVWKTDDGEDLFFDKEETVRFRVEEEEWHDQTPLGPTDRMNEENGVVVVKQNPYGIIASMEDAGLGPCMWWDGEDMLAE